MLPKMPSLCGAVCALMLAFGPPAQAIIGGSSPTEPLTALSHSTLLLRDNQGACSATLVGPRVILTAAYCIGGDQTAKLDVNGNTLRLKCSPHPSYPADDSAAFALCKLDQEFPAKPERIGSDPALLGVETKIYLAGLGCHRTGGVDGSLGALRIGEASVVTTPAFSGGDANIIADGSGLCAGDSGGGAYVKTSANERLLVGVLARGDLKARSYSPSTLTETFLKWAKEWISTNGVRICGIDGDAGCSEAAIPTAANLDNALNDSLAASKSAVNELETSLTTTVETRKDETVDDLARRVCRAAQPNEYFDQFDRYQKDSGSGIDRHTVFSEVRSIAMPLCSKSRIVTVTVAKKDKPWDYWVKYTKGQTPLWIDFMRPPNTGSKGEFSGYFMDVFEFLNPEVDINRLQINSNVRVPLYPIEEQQSGPLVAMGSTSVEPILAKSSLGCTTKPGSDHPYDLGLLLDVLARNRIHEPVPRSIGILVADSGLYGAGSHAMFRKNVLLHRGELDQTYIDKISPLQGGPDYDHGTQVASVAVGGPIFGRIQVLSNPRIRLGTSRIYQTYAREGRVWFGAVEQGFNQVLADAKEGAEIINFSAKYKTDILALKPQLGGDNPRFLFVVAAGNHDGELGPETKNEIYPALYGGSSSNVITVAALEAGTDQSGTRRLAKFSNYSDRYVDIAAPGCAIPALTFVKSQNNWKTENLDGTSVATPLVSFAAALVKSEVPSGFSAIETKVRILMSSDLNPGEAKKVIDGRTLNIPKAVALYDDVVQLNNGDLLFGRVNFEQNGTELDDDQSFTLNCDGAIKPFIANRILKIWPRFKTIEGLETARIYVRGATEPMRTEECVLTENASDPNHLEVILQSEGRTRPLSFQEIRDVVRRTF